jgi:hypothetical protein
MKFFPVTHPLLVPIDDISAGVHDTMSFSLTSNKMAELAVILPSAARPSYTSRPAAFCPLLSDGLAFSGIPLNSLITRPKKHVKL